MNTAKKKKKERKKERSRLTDNRTNQGYQCVLGRGAGEAQTAGCEIGSRMYCTTWNIAIIAADGK